MAGAIDWPIAAVNHHVRNAVRKLLDPAFGSFESFACARVDGRRVLACTHRQGFRGCWHRSVPNFFLWDFCWESGLDLKKGLRPPRPPRGLQERERLGLAARCVSSSSISVLTVPSTCRGGANRLGLTRRPSPAFQIVLALSNAA